MNAFRRRSFLPGRAIGAIVLGLVGCGGKGPTPDYPPLPSVTRDVSEGESPVEMSLVRIAYRFEPDGRYIRTFQDRYRILREDAVEDWGSTGAQWSPWQMKRPVISATVTSATGTKTTLEPSAIAESSAYPNAPDQYGDERMLRAPLPNLGPGAVVDELITYEAIRPWIGGGAVQTVIVQSGLARKHVELVIDLPEKMPFKYQLRDIDIPKREEIKGGRRVVTFSGGPYPAVKSLEPSAPSDLADWPSIVFSTNTEWKPLAAEYARIVDEKLTGANLEGVVEKVVLPADSPQTKASKLMAWIRARARYVAVEFGDSSVVPRTPDQTIKHGYGDCKDQAVLLVALLRAAGVKANVVLLRAGYGEDVIPALPGLNVFNHAIVRIEGATPVWIDPTATHTRAGELPTADQGRWALVVDPASNALVRTPQATQASNSYSETRQIFLSEYGPSRVVETTSATGAIESSLRDEYDAEPTALAKWHKTYVDKTYSAKVAGAFDVVDAKDLSKPFAMKLEAKESRYAVTGLVSSSTPINPNLALVYVPRNLLFGKDRKTDYALQVPHDATVVFELHPPPGFSVDEKPEAREVTLGPATFKQSVDVRPDGTVSVTMKLALPKSRWSAADVNAFQTAYWSFAGEKSPVVSFVHEAERLHRARAYDKELAAYRAAIAKDPSPLAKLRLAVALHGLGFGGAARKLADDVAKSDPTIADYWDQIAFIRHSDRLGRSTRPGWDHAGAIAAFRKAFERDPDDLYAATSLATSLEYDDDAERYAPGAKLEEAVAAFDRIPAEKLASYDDGGYLANVLFDWMWAGQYQKVRDRAKTIPRSKIAEVPLIVSAAMLSGGNAGLAEADRLAIPKEQKRSTLVSAADVLVRLRHYPEAAALLGAAAATTSDPQLRNRVGIITKAKPVDAHALPSAKPLEVATKVALLCTLEEPTLSNDLVPLTSSALSPRKDETRATAACGPDFHSTISKHARQSLADVVAAMIEPKVEGSDDVGYRVSLMVGSSTTPFFVQSEGKTSKVRTVGSRPSELGCEALTLSKAGKKAAATQWLTWAKELRSNAGGDDPLRDLPFVRLWTDKKDEVALAAAALCAEGGHPDVVVPSLAAARKGAKGERAQTLEYAIALAYADGDHDADLLTHAGNLTKELPSSWIAWNMQRYALRKLGRFKELRDLATARLAKEPNDPVKLDDLASAEDLLGHSKEARAAGDKLLATGKANAYGYNNQAWRSLFGGGIGTVEIGWALRAVTADPRPSYLNTLAALDAEAGNVADGVEQFQKSVADVDEADLGGADWFVYGRLAEQLGLPEEARAAYAKIKTSPKENGEHTVFKLAEKRLASIKL